MFQMHCQHGRNTIWAYMDFKKLRNFVRIVELNSITAAADQLNIAQPALSRQVKALEDELKVPLLLRHGRGVMPTQEGIQLAKRAKIILEDVDALASEFSGGRQALSGTLTLGLAPAVAGVLATHLIEKSFLEFPKVKLRINSGFSGHIHDWLLRGKADLAVSYKGQISSSVKIRPIIQERLFYIQTPEDDATANDTPIQIAHALNQPLILPNAEHVLRKQVNSIAQSAKIDLNVILEVNILPTIVAFVERGLGNTILPLVSVANQLQSGQLIARPISQCPLQRTLVLLTPANHPASRLATEFSEFLISEIHHLVANGDWPGTEIIA